MISVKTLEGMFRTLGECCLHEPLWWPRDVERILASIQDGPNWRDCVDEHDQWKDSTESESYTVVLLRDGRFGLLQESEDFTGHGCVCDSATMIYPRMSELLANGVTEDSARNAIKARLMPAAVDEFLSAFSVASPAVQRPAEVPAQSSDARQDAEEAVAKLAKAVFALNGERPGLYLMSVAVQGTPEKAVTRWSWAWWNEPGEAGETAAGEAGAEGQG